MYRPANYYAARTAAIKEALEQERAKAAQMPCRKIELQAPTSAESLRNAGRKVLVRLGVFFGDRSGTVVTVRYCYAVGKFWYGLYHADDGKEYVLMCCYEPNSSMMVALTCEAEV